MFRAFLRYAFVGLIILIGLDLLILENRVHHITHDALPRTFGTSPAEGLGQDIEIVRDDYGIAHVLAKTDNDAFFGMGYVMAQDRLFQMDLARRMAQGRLSEIFGSAALSRDKEARVIGYRRTAEAMLQNMPQETRAALDAFTAGVNAAMDAMDGAKPVEFHVLRYRPEPWQALDSTSIAVLQFAFFSNSWESELLAYELAAERGEDVMRTLMPPPGAFGPSIIPAGSVAWEGGAEPSDAVETETTPEEVASLGAREVARALLAHIEATPEMHPNLQASNNWAVAGSRTASGHAIFAGDPHLGYSIPSTLYEVHVKGATFEIAGMTVAGLPAIFGGHNRWIAYSPTVSNVDAQDLYIEQPHPSDPEKLYVVPGGVKQFRRYRERIEVNGGDAVELIVRESRHGPILNDLLDEHGDDLPLFALSWSAQRGDGDPFTGALAVMRARNWDAFRTGLSTRNAVNMNYVFAAKDGDIGYALSGVIPRRAPGHDATMPVPGDVDDYEWQGWVPGAEMPALHNPDGGYVLSANNWIAADYPHHLQHFCVPGFRAARINQVLAENRNMTIEDMQALQLDDTSLFGLGLAPAIVRAVESQGGTHTAQEREALSALRDWDGRMAEDSAAALILAAVAKDLAAATFADEMSPLAYGQYLDWIRARMGTLYVMVTEGYAPELWDDRTTDGTETQDDILAATFRSTIASLSGEHGESVASWAWGDSHVLNLTHTLDSGLRDSIPVLGSLIAGYLNAGSAPQSGSWDTPRASGYNWRTPGFAVRYGAAWRFVVDMHDTESAVAALPGGVSGQPASDHYDDQSMLYAEGAYRDVLVTLPRDDARAQRRTLTLSAKR